MDDALNWLWQGCAMAAAAAAALHLLRRSRASHRYALCAAALGAVLALPFLSAVWTAASSGGASASTLPAESLVALPPAWWTSGRLLAVAAGVWCGVYAVRLVRALAALRRVRRRCMRFPASLESGLAYWQHVRTSGRRAPLVLSRDVPSAAVLGWGAPLIAVSPALARRLSAAELDRIVVHEWAHVQRRDDLAVLAQHAAVVLAGWHPAIWWLARQLRIEREAACDEMAVAVSGSRKAYASALLTLAELPLMTTRSLPVAGAMCAPSLSARVERILAGDCAVPPARSLAAASAAVAVLVVCAVVVSRLPVVGSAVQTPASPASARATASLPPIGLASAAPRMVAAGDADRSPAALPVVHRSGGTVSPRRPGAPPPSGANRDIPRTTVVDVPVRTGLASAAIFEDAGTGHPAASFPETTERGRDAVTAAAAAGSDIAARETESGVDTNLDSGTAAAPFWKPAADAGTAIGRGSRRAGTAAAGAFSRFGREIAASF